MLSGNHRQLDGALIEPPLLFLFGIFLGVNLAFSAVIDVIADKILIKKWIAKNKRIEMCSGYL
jgi:hypothetical protein